MDIDSYTDSLLAQIHGQRERIVRQKLMRAQFMAMNDGDYILGALLDKILKAVDLKEVPVLLAGSDYKIEIHESPGWVDMDPGKIGVINFDMSKLKVVITKTIMEV